LGGVWIVQRLPFQASASVTLLGPKLTSPTAVQAVLDVHDTPSSSPSLEDVGLGWIDQRLPSHRSANVPPPMRPTAVQAVLAVHDTPSRTPKPEEVGVGWIDQRFPFQASASVRSVPKLSCSNPTATQTLLDMHDTAKRLPFAAAGLGVL
jgi:hypothetical protein